MCSVRGVRGLRDWCLRAATQRVLLIQWFLTKASSQKSLAMPHTSQTNDKGPCTVVAAEEDPFWACVLGAHSEEKRSEGEWIEESTCSPSAATDSVAVGNSGGTALVYEYELPYAHSHFRLPPLPGPNANTNAMTNPNPMSNLNPRTGSAEAGGAGTEGGLGAVADTGARAGAHALAGMLKVEIIETRGQGVCDAIGGVVWEAGLLLSAFLLLNPEVCAGKRVLELGCGCGLVGRTVLGIRRGLKEGEGGVWQEGQGGEEPTVCLTDSDSDLLDTLCAQFRQEAHKGEGGQSAAKPTPTPTPNPTHTHTAAPNPTPNPNSNPNPTKYAAATAPAPNAAAERLMR